MTEPQKEPPTKEELMARLQDLHGRAVELRDRANAQARAQSGVKWGRVLLIFGLPIGAAVGVYLGTHSILFTVLGFLAGFIAIVMIASRNAPAGTRPGTRAWEAKMNVDLLERVIAQRHVEKQQTQDPAKRARFDREIAHLTTQLADNTVIWQSGDASPGKGYVGFDAYNGD
jgi:hypothetical protein